MNAPEAKIFEIRFRQTAPVGLGEYTLMTRRFQAAYYQSDDPWLVFKNPLHKPIFQVQQHLVESIEEITENENEVASRVQSGELTLNEARRILGFRPWPLDFAEKRYDWRFKDGPVPVDKR